MASHEGNEGTWFHVYCWLSAASVEAEVFACVRAADAMSALQAVMQAGSLSFVAYAWVVPHDETLTCLDAWEVAAAASDGDAL